MKLKRKTVEILETNKATIQLAEQFTQTVNQTKHHDFIALNTYNFTNKLLSLKFIPSLLRKYFQALQKSYPTRSEEQLIELKSQQEYTALIRVETVGKIKPVAPDNQILASDFSAFNNQSAVSIAFHAKQYKTFVLLKSRGFHQFWYEEPLAIESLSEKDKLALKQAMGDLLRKNNY